MSAADTNRRRDATQRSAAPEQSSTVEPLTSDPLYRSRPDGFAIQPASDSGAVEVVPGVYLSEGLSNSFMVGTTEGRVIVNAGMGFEAPAHRKNFDAIDSSPVRAVLLTQGHVDHVGGVDAFLEDGTDVVAQARNAEHQAYDARLATFRARRSAFAFAGAIETMLRHADDDALPQQSTPRPTVTFDDRYEFELGGERFECLATPGGETRDSMVVWMPQRRLCFCGNLFSALFGHFPNLVTIRGDRYRDPLEFVASLERVRSLGAEVLAVGHHEPVRGRELIDRELIRLRDAVLYVHDTVVAAMNEGRDLFETVATLALPSELDVGQGYGQVGWSARAIWEQYGGWFHHRHTSELYAVAPDAADAELVALAGGAKVVASRGRALLEGGDTKGALRLAEAALKADSDCSAAVELSIDVHRRLESESANFWLTSWIRAEIARLEARKAGQR